MIIWITTILCLVIPGILALSGRGIVGLSLSAACIYGIGALAGFGIGVLPPPFVKFILAAAEWGPVSSVDRVYHDTYYVIQSLRYMTFPTLIFVAVTLVFWALSRWGATYSKLLTSGLFWLIHVSYLAIPIMTVLLFRNDMPRRYIDYDDTFSRIELISSLLALTCIAGLCALAGVATLSAVKRLRACPPPI